MKLTGRVVFLVPRIRQVLTRQEARRVTPRTRRGAYIDYTFIKVKPASQNGDRRRAWLYHALGRQVLVASSLDYVSSILPHVLGMVGLGFIKSKLRCRSGHVVPLTATNKNSGNVSEGFLALRSEAKGPSCATAEAPTEQAQFLKTIRRAFHFVSCGWTVPVISLHVQAQYCTGTKPSLKDAWSCSPRGSRLAAPCAALLFNCHARGEIGCSSQQIDGYLDTIERSVLRIVIFSHCPALEMPPIVVREFSNLNAIGMFNCTIRTWDIDAAISHRLTPTLALLQLLDTNMTGIPDGFAHAELPPVFSLNLYRSNLSSLPETIGDTCGQVGWSTLWLDYTQLTSLPESFSRVQATKLSFEASAAASLLARALLRDPTSRTSVRNGRHIGAHNRPR